MSRRSLLPAAGFTGVAAGLTRFGAVWVTEGQSNWDGSTNLQWQLVDLE